MTERELLETLARARRALTVASWGVVRAAMAEEPTGEDPLTGALARLRRARRALGKARADWHQRFGEALLAYRAPDGAA